MSDTICEIIALGTDEIKVKDITIKAPCRVQHSNDGNLTIFKRPENEIYGNPAIKETIYMPKDVTWEDVLEKIRKNNNQYKA